MNLNSELFGEKSLAHMETMELLKLIFAQIYLQKQLDLL